MYEKELQEIGLTMQQSYIYSILIMNNGLKAIEVFRKIEEKNKLNRKINRQEDLWPRLSRQGVYLAINELIEMNLASKLEKDGAVTTYYALPPRALREKIKKRQIEVESSRSKLDAVMGDLDSLYNLNSGKPGVEFFEGEEATNYIQDDMLKSKTDIYSYVDPTPMLESEDIQNSNYDLLKKRIKRKINKKVILYNIGADLEKTINTYLKDSKGFTEIKVMKKEKVGNKSYINIYDGKVSYLNFEKGKTISVVITDKKIYKTHKLLFEEAWEMLGE